MKKVATEIIINTNPEHVWKILTNFENHQYWDPFMKDIHGELILGNKIIVTVKPPKGNAMTFNPKIVKFDPNKELRWRGKVGLECLFQGEHYFILEKTGESQTKFIHGEDFKGLLIFFASKLINNSKEGYTLMNESLKKECEKMQK